MDAAAPRLDCLEAFESGSARIQMKDDPEDTRDSLRWIWRKGPSLDAGDLGDGATDDYWLCVYDNGHRVTSARIPSGPDCGAKPCWEVSDKGIAYASRSDLPEGATQLEIKAGDDGRSLAKFRGGSVSFEMPQVSSIVGPLEVRLSRGDGSVCLSSKFSPPFRRHDSTRLSAASN